VVNFANEKKVDVLLCPTKFKSIIRKYRQALGQPDLAIEAAKINLAAPSTKAM
jgi:hypothetical protein